MKRKLSTTLALVVFAVALAASGARAQTVANGPYYAPPSWDQTLPSSTRFIVLSNMGSNAVLDRETGLVWEKSPHATPVNWIDAHVRCNGLGVGNRAGWRVPTLQELASLVDRDPANISSPRLPPAHPFINVQSSPYWSATTYSPIPGGGFAWFVGFDLGTVSASLKTNFSGVFVWCVRGGQGVDPQ